MNSLFLVIALHIINISSDRIKVYNKTSMPEKAIIAINSLTSPIPIALIKPKIINGIAIARLIHNVSGELMKLILNPIIIAKYEISLGTLCVSISIIADTHKKYRQMVYIKISIQNLS